MIHRRTIVCVALLAGGLSLGLGPPSTAMAGTYDVFSCDAAPDHSIAGWEGEDTRGMDADRLCPWRGDMRRGLILRNKVEEGRIDRGGGAELTFRAPPGTELVGMGFRWDGYRASEDWSIGLSSGDEWLAGCRGGSGGECSLGGNAAGRKWIDLAGRRTVRLEATCAARGGCDTSSTHEPAQHNQRARILLAEATVRVSDPSKPGVSGAAGGLWQDGWQRGIQQVSFDASDNTGIRRTGLAVDGKPRFGADRACTYTRPVPCANVSGQRYGLDTTGLQDGAHAVTLQAVDASGNVGEVTRTLHVDNNPPGAFFEPQRTNDPRAVVLAVSDTASGTAGGRIELRPAGSQGVWRPLASALTGGRIVATLPPGLGEGVYEVRARVADRAGNERATASRKNGARMLLTIPGDSRLRAGILGRGGRPVGRLRVGPGERVRTAGRLAARRGEPIAGAKVTILSRDSVGGAAWRRVGAARTNREGAFRHTVPAGPSRELRFDYDGSRQHRPATGRAGVTTPAATSLRASRRRVKTGDRVRFRGQLEGRPISRTGKLVDLQAFYRGRWRTFAVPRTDARGRWDHRYRFGATTGVVKYPFRARVPREDGYPYASGRSRVVKVVVDGRRDKDAAPGD